MKDYPPGTRVTVLSRYEGGGRFARDGYEGEWHVVRRNGNDLLLDRDSARSSVWVHLSRIDGDSAASWRPDQVKPPPSMPTMTCPRCGAEHPDFDGFGMVAHTRPAYPDGCGYCTHPSRDGDGTGGMVCGICGDVRRD